MNYRNDKSGNKVSILGYGCMRFSRKNGGVDIEKTEKEIMAAFEAGVNYYDTAYLYPGSEDSLGQILEKNGIREKVNIATKLPQYLVKKPGDIDKFFDEELRRLRTGYVDYYLMHHITDFSQWERLKRLGIGEWIAAQKTSGRIRNIGFSYHGNTDGFVRALNDFDWDFCQIQYNYVDETSQAGRAGLEAAQEKGIPVIIMEPLRGGKLVDKLPVKAKKLVADSGIYGGLTLSDTGKAAALAFRWLWDQPGVTCVLSGMNSLEMIKENCAAADASQAGCMEAEERELISKIKKIISETEKVGCTGCRYCMPCPAGVDIPTIFYYYNLMYSDGKWTGRSEYAQTNSLRNEPAFATLCVGCGKCESHCPQEIPIRAKLKEADRALRPLPYKIGAKIMKKYMVRK
ncbi:MAG: aldo/keto reductase [Lachnospiraceae bacterium]|nr:aldo/keto reductase [Lachnospiraceae bacterium]